MANDIIPQAPAALYAQAPQPGVNLAVVAARVPVTVSNPPVVQFRNAGQTANEDRLIHLSALGVSRLMAGVALPIQGQAAEGLAHSLLIGMQRGRAYQRDNKNLPPITRRLLSAPVLQQRIAPEGVARYVANAMLHRFGPDRLAIIQQDAALANDVLTPVVTAHCSDTPSGADDAVDIVLGLMAATTRFDLSAYPRKNYFPADALLHLMDHALMARHQAEEVVGMQALIKTAIFTANFVGDARRPVPEMDASWNAAFEAGLAKRDLRESAIPAPDRRVPEMQTQLSARYTIGGPDSA